jgi:uncharacterized membrane protein
MPATNEAALTVAYWLHMLATTLWVGGLGLVVLLILPAARRAMDLKAYLEFSGRLVNQVQSLGWFALLLLVGTGMFQLSSNPNYNGFLAINNRWAIAILVKHLLFGGVLLISAYITWGIGPALRRKAMVAAHKGADRPDAAADVEMLQKRQSLMMKANIVLGVIILALTALARIS